MWARSAWAGSQRYPAPLGRRRRQPRQRHAVDAPRRAVARPLGLHRSGATTSAASRRSTPEELYRRWLPFGMLTSHSRAHGAPPKEPWEYGPSFTEAFRRAAEMKYRLMPYVYAQAKDSSRARAAHAAGALRRVSRTTPARGRSRTSTSSARTSSWRRSSRRGRRVATCTCLPARGSTTRRDAPTPAAGSSIEAGAIPAVILVRDGAAIPHAARRPVHRADRLVEARARHLRRQGRARPRASCACPSDDVLREVAVDAGGRFLPPGDPLAGQVRWTVRSGTRVQ